jgi:hypothetical protein
MFKAEPTARQVSSTAAGRETQVFFIVTMFAKNNIDEIKRVS